MSPKVKSDRDDSPDETSLQTRRVKRWPIIAVVVFFGVFIFMGISFVGATALEEHDTFCTSCHTVPETTYFQRANALTNNINAVVTDLATYHYQQAQAKGQSFECIQCHRGDASLTQRVQTLALGAK